MGPSEPAARSRRTKPTTTSEPGATDAARPSYTRIGRIGGAGWVHGSAAVATYAVGLVTDHEPTVHVGSDLIRAQALNGVLTRVMKIAVQRKRPSGSSDSLPSGHASASFATAAVLGGHFGWKVAVPAYAGAGFIGWTRVRDRAHWLSDVVDRRHHRHHRRPHGDELDIGARSWTVTPTAGRGSVGVMVVRVRRTENRQFRSSVLSFK